MDPTKREKRKAALESIRHSNPGELLRLYKRAKGIPAGNPIPLGTLGGQIIDEILQREFDATGERADS